MSKVEKMIFYVTDCSDSIKLPWVYPEPVEGSHSCTPARCAAMRGSVILFCLLILLHGKNHSQSCH
jgi:hypothetical protein